MVDCPGILEFQTVAVDVAKVSEVTLSLNAH